MVKTTNAGSKGLIPGWGTKIPHAMQCGQDNLKKIALFLKKLNLELSYDPAVSLLGIYLEKTNLERRAPQCRTIHNSEDMEGT